MAVEEGTKKLHHEKRKVPLPSEENLNFAPPPCGQQKKEKAFINFKKNAAPPKKKKECRSRWKSEVTRLGDDRTW